MLRQILIYLCFIVYITTGTEENLTESVTVNTTLPIMAIGNKTDATDATKSKNITVNMQRITQPVVENHIQVQSLGRTLNISERNGTSSPQTFRPSPQLNTYYEYNRFPVVPAHPEAKHFSVLNTNEKPLRSDILSWERTFPNYHTTTQLPWHNKISFPTSQNPFISMKQHPYPYLINNYETTTKAQYPYIVTGTNYLTPNIQYTYETTTKAYTLPQGFSKPGNGLSISEKLGGIQKTNFGTTALGNAGSTSSPWQKVIKFLTAVIPIGLLITALTPTIINVSPMNATQRGRSLEAREYATQHLISSLNYINKLNKRGCEERVLCELLKGTESIESAEKHAQNLLKVVAEEEQTMPGGIDELKKVFEAVKAGNCSCLTCDYVETEG